MKRHRGFTLIELLVVVSIIALLIAILLPSLSKGMAIAKRAACASNLHQQMLAMKMYTANNRLFYPGGHAGTGTAGDMTWASRIRAYAGNDYSVFNCQAEESPFHWQKTEGSGLKARWGYDQDERHVFPSSAQAGAKGLTGFSYGYNDWGIQEFTTPHLGGGNYVDSSPPPGYEWGELKMTRVKSPSEWILLADSTPDHVWDYIIDGGDPPNYLSEQPGNRHLGGPNVACGDGHVEWNQQEFWLAKNENMGRRWNSDNQSHPEHAFWY